MRTERAGPVGGQPVSTRPGERLPPAAPRTAGSRVLVGGVGYANLRDHSAGPLLLEWLGPLGERVDVEDLSYSPIDVLFLLQRREPYRGVVLTAAVARGDAPGTVRIRRWTPPLETAEGLQERVAEAVTGVISLDNLLHICAHFGALPTDVVTVEIEPAEEGWGPGTSPTVTAAFGRAADGVWREVERMLAGPARPPDGRSLR